MLTDYDIFGGSVGHPPIDRVLYPIQSQPGYFYFYDAVNRPFAFTPNPIWVAQFPGIRSRTHAEERMTGVPGQSFKEMLHHRRSYEAFLRSQGLAEVADEKK